MLRIAAMVSVTATVLASGCGSAVNGRATCPGCGTQAEPSVPTTRLRVSPPAAPDAPSAPATGAPPIALAPDSSGYVFIETKSGGTRCQISRLDVGCEAEFANSPVQHGEPANGVHVTADGQLRWVLGNLGDIPAVTLDYQTYHALGWTIDAASSGTRFTNDRTGHGMFVSIEAVNGF
ncbi:MAG: hypothetical protein JO044_08335 [Mycobacteriaceae bacterium]|nr:hypothetical protein [Mycobacteriaceae bacterium]MBV9641060.1 hypothetical protein [Mycobacteriaceae bacterium]